jgi:hypothetical protein
VELDYAMPQAFEVRFDDDGTSDVLAARPAAGWRSSVRLNGREVWRVKNPHHPFVAGEVTAGCNPIGASCRRYFGGAILSWEFLGDGLGRQIVANGAGRIFTTFALPPDLAAKPAQPLAAYRNGVGARGVLAVRRAGSSAIEVGWIEAEQEIWSERIACAAGATPRLEARWPAPSQPASVGEPGLSAEKFMRGRLGVFSGWSAGIPAAFGILGSAGCGGRGWPQWLAVPRFARRTVFGKSLGRRAGRSRAGTALEHRADPAVPRGGAVPGGPAGVCEPLLTAGRTGAADGVFVRYFSGQEIRIGFDHWGTGGPESPPVAIDYSKPHEIELTIGAGSWEAGGSGPLSVRLDGRDVIAGHARFHAAGAGEVVFGRNTVGLSTSVPEFSGMLISLEGR